MMGAAAPREARAEATRAAGVATPGIGWPQVAAYRDHMIRNLDDAAQVQAYRDDGVDVFNGDGRIDGPGRVTVSGGSSSATPRSRPSA